MGHARRRRALAGFTRPRRRTALDRNARCRRSHNAEAEHCGEPQGEGLLIALSLIPSTTDSRCCRRCSSTPLRTSSSPSPPCACTSSGAAGRRPRSSPCPARMCSGSSRLRPTSGTASRCCSPRRRGCGSVRSSGYGGETSRVGSCACAARWTRWATSGSPSTTGPGRCRCRSSSRSGGCGAAGCGWCPRWTAACCPTGPAVDAVRAVRTRRRGRAGERDGRNDAVALAAAFVRHGLRAARRSAGDAQGAHGTREDRDDPSLRPGDQRGQAPRDRPGVWATGGQQVGRSHLTS